MARTALQARNYLVFGGAIHLVLFLHGLLVGQESDANFVPMNPADDILHFVLGIGMLGLGRPLADRVPASWQAPGKAARLAFNADGGPIQRVGHRASVLPAVRVRRPLERSRRSSP